MENAPTAPSGVSQPAPLENQITQMSLSDAAPDDTPESVRFRSLPHEMQRRILVEYPRILATSMHLYGQGADCESILMQTFENTSEMLRARNTEGDNPLAVALLRNQDQRAEKLMELADKKNPAALDDRSQFRETLLMLSTSSSSAARLAERLLIREPTQLHRLYDNGGRNFLHHCAMDESVETLDAALRVTRHLIQEGRVQAAQVSAAVHMNDRRGDTPMHIMASHNRHDMLGLLVQFSREVEININLDERQHTRSHWTPMMSGVSAGAVDAVAYLLDNGADPTEEDSDGRTAIDMAAENDRLMELFKDHRREEEMEVVDCYPVTELKQKAAPEGSSVSWLTSSHQVLSVDSGVDSMPSASSTVDSLLDHQLSSSDLECLEAHLSRVGKSSIFLAALSRQNPRLTAVCDLVEMSDKPIVTAFSIWTSCHETVQLEIVLGAMKEVGELANWRGANELALQAGR